MRRVPAILVVLVLLVGACSSSDGDDDDGAGAAAPTSERSGGCEPARAIEPGVTRRTIESGGLERSYLVYAPPSYDGRSPVPVVLNYHGYSSAADQQLVYADFRPIADREGFLLVLPDGAGRPRHFNLGAVSLGGTHDDVAFTRDLLDRLARDLCVDERRVYSTGMSNGAAMSLALACLAPDRVAAIGPVAVVAYLPACDEGRPVAMVSFAGTADPIVPFDGGPVNCCGRPAVPSAPESAARWAAHNGCDAAPTERRLDGAVLVRSWRGCDEGADVDFYVVEGGGHTWPGSAIRPPQLGRTADLPASEVIWSFFDGRALPA